MLVRALLLSAAFSWGAAAAQQLRIVGGTAVTPSDFPYFVRVRTLGQDGRTYRCGGTLVAPNAVLTAAHCVTSAVSATVTVGGQTVTASSFVIHPAYDKTIVVHDAAVLWLPSPTTTPPLPLDSDGQVRGAPPPRPPADRKVRRQGGLRKVRRYMEFVVLEEPPPRCIDPGDKPWPPVQGLSPGS